MLRRENCSRKNRPNLLNLKKSAAGKKTDWWLYTAWWCLLKGKLWTACESVDDWDNDIMWILHNLSAAEHIRIAYGASGYTGQSNQLRHSPLPYVWKKAFAACEIKRYLVSHRSWGIDKANWCYSYRKSHICKNHYVEKSKSIIRSPFWVRESRSRFKMIFMYYPLLQVAILINSKPTFYRVPSFLPHFLFRFLLTLYLSLLTELANQSTNFVRRLFMPSALMIAKQTIAKRSVQSLSFCSLSILSYIPYVPTSANESHCASLRHHSVV